MELEGMFIGFDDANLVGIAGQSELHALSSSNQNTITIRSGLFKPETQINDKPLADKTIQAIKSRLTLFCIMDDNAGKPVAFVKIQGEGLKECYVGDTVNDMFTVLSIDKEKNSIKISIVDHEVKLAI